MKPAAVRSEQSHSPFASAVATNAMSIRPTNSVISVEGGRTWSA